MSTAQDLIDNYHAVYTRLRGPVQSKPVARHMVPPPHPTLHIAAEVVETEALPLPMAIPETPVDIPTAEPLAWKRIMREVADRHGLTVVEMIGGRRSNGHVFARHEAFYRLSKELGMTLPRIGFRMGGMDHTTVLSGIRKYEDYLRRREAAICSDEVEYCIFRGTKR